VKIDGGHGVTAVTPDCRSTGCAHREVTIDSTREPSPLDSVIFIDRYGVRITGAWLDVPGARYPVRDLERVWTGRGPRGTVSSIVLVATGVVLSVGAVVAARATTTGGRLVVVSLLALAMVAALSLLRAHPRPLLLNAVHQGHLSTVLETTDLTFFNQICRALSRARQLNAERSRLAGQDVGVDPAFASGYRGSLLGVDGALIGLALAVLIGVGLLIAVDALVGDVDLTGLPWP